MSSHCRRFGTAIMSRRAKLLITKDRVTVAKDRQSGRLMTHQDIRSKRHKVHAVSRSGTKSTFFSCALINGDGTEYRLTTCTVNAMRRKILFDFVQCRAFETLHRRICVSYNRRRSAPDMSSNPLNSLVADCDCVNGTPLLPRRTLP